MHAGKRQDFRHFLSTERAVVLDGGLATELERKGCDISSALWSAEVLINNPNLIKDVHLDYYRAGADVAITASYQASIAGLLKHNISMTEQQAMDLIKLSVRLARDARDALIHENRDGIPRDMFVAGSVGPYGAFLADGAEYRGDYELPKDEMRDFHRGRVNALVEAGVDLLAFETIPSFAETVALVHLLEEYPDMNCWFSFTLKDADHISDETPLSALIQLLDNHKQILAVGFNCVSEDLVDRALVALSALTQKPLVAYPNSGERYDAESKTWSGERAHGDMLQDIVLGWYGKQARLIGGCCRTTPEDIRTIRRALPC